MEQEKKPRNKTICLWPINPLKKSKKRDKNIQKGKWYWEKWATRCKRKKKIRTLSHIRHKNKLKMGYKPKCKTGQYKTLRRNYRQNILTEIVTIAFWIYLQSNENINTNK